MQCRTIIDMSKTQKRGDRQFELCGKGNKEEMTLSKLKHCLFEFGTAKTSSSSSSSSS
jgi:hypothetical protein